MRYLTLATDYDGTLACNGRVAPATIAALERFRRSGRKLILVTGRVIEDLATVFPRLDLFDRVAAENGAVLYTPGTRKMRALARPPQPLFLETLRRRGVRPLGAGEVIVATTRPQETEVLKVIGELGLKLQVIFNRSSVMVLPFGINKMTGLMAVLDELALSAQDVVAVGDAENDHAFLHCCGCSAAVSNAIAGLKEAADLVMDGADGAGVAQLIEMILRDDLASQELRLKRRRSDPERCGPEAGRVPDRAC